MARKDATMFILDMGSSMSSFIKSNNHEKRTTRFNLGQQMCLSLLSEKLLFASKEHVGFLCVGSNETDNICHETLEGYEHISVLFPISTNSKETIRQIEKVGVNSTLHGDYVDALIVAMEMLTLFVQTRKWNKRIVFVTDGASKIAHIEDLGQVVQALCTQGIAVDIITVDCDDLEKNKEDDGCKVQVENCKMLKSLAKKSLGSFVSAESLLAQQGALRQMGVNQTISFKGELEICPTLLIPIQSIKKTSKLTLPQLTLEAPVYDKEAHTGKVSKEYVYTVKENPSEEMMKEEMVTAFKYGRDYVPLDDADLIAAKFMSIKSLKLLACFPKEALTVDHIVGETSFFCAPADQPSAQKAISALVRALHEEGLVAVVRSVRQKNAAVKLLAFTPYFDSSFEGFCAQPIAFEDDLRQFPFYSLEPFRKQLTEKQTSVAERLVSSLTIDATRDFDPATCFNPGLQRFYQTVPLRSENPEADVVPIPKQIHALMDMSQELLLASKETRKEFMETFELKRVLKELKAKKRKHWHEQLMKEKGTTSVVETEAGQDETVVRPLNDDLNDDEEQDDGGPLQNVGAMNPISDFNALLFKGTPKHVLHAFDSMSKQIVHFMENGSFKAFKCLQLLQTCAVEYGQANAYNTLLRLVVTRFASPEIYTKIVECNLSLFSREDDPTIDTTMEDVVQFSNVLQSTI